jgi:uncharacterized protein YbaP (TraB family)
MFSAFKTSATQCTAIVLFALVSLNSYAAPGLFWKAEAPDKSTVYLFGTIHTDDNRVTEFSPAVINALKSTDVFMMETKEAQDTKSLNMANASLKELLTEDELDQVYALADFHVMHRHAVLRMKPWLLAAIFDSPRPLTPFAQDNLLMTKAEDLGKEVRGLETAAEHFGAMDSLQLDEQLLMLRAVLKRSDDQKLKDYERLIKAYLVGDSAKLAALDDKITGGMLPPELWQRMRVKLLDERNVLMAERIVEAAKSHSLFVAVGASHLAGQTGLTANLNRSGFTLSPVK